MGAGCAQKQEEEQAVCGREQKKDSATRVCILARWKDGRKEVEACALLLCGFGASGEEN